MVGDLRAWAKENPLLATVALVLGAGLAGMGIVFGTGVLIVLAAEAPFVLLVLLFVALLFGGMAVRSGLSLGDEEEERDVDPLTELERRYVRGEISEEEFERRLTTILHANERAEREADPELELER